MSSRERSRADDFSRAQRFRWKAPFDGRSKFSQTQRRTLQTILAGAFFHELPVLEHPNLESRKLLDELGDQFRLNLHLLADTSAA